MLRWFQSATARGSSSAAVLQLRRVLCVAAGHEPEGKRDRVSEAVMEKRVRAREKRKGGQHGSAVVVVYLGHGGLEEATAA